MTDVSHLKHQELYVYLADHDVLKHIETANKQGLHKVYIDDKTFRDLKTIQNKARRCMSMKMRPGFTAILATLIACGLKDDDLYRRIADNYFELFENGE
jgi:hypothetical protein